MLAAQSFQTKLGFDTLDVWQDLRSRPLDEQKVLLRDPDLRARLVHAAHHGDYGRAPSGAEATRPKFDTMQVLLSPYMPNPTVVEEAARRGVDPVEAMIDIALERDLDAFFLQIVTPQDPDRLVELMHHPRTAMGFSDSGAHVSQIFDASIFSHLLAYWVRERAGVHARRGDPADHVAAGQHLAAPRPGPARAGLRGRRHGVRPRHGGAGHAGGAPRPARRRDAPRAERRWATTVTIVNGQVVTRDGEATEARPGRLLRGPVAGVA